RPELLDVHGRSLHLQGGVQRLRVRHRRRRGDDRLRRHLRADGRATRDGGTGDRGLMVDTTAAAPARPYIPGRARSEVLRRVIVYTLLVLVSLLFFVPFIWTVTTSFKTIPDSVNVTLIPHPWTTAAWHDIWTQYDFKRFFLNSLFLAVVVTVSN